MVSFDVVESILVRCRLEDIIRCRSVCRSWYVKLLGRAFSLSHLKFINNREDNTRKIGMIRSYYIRIGSSEIILPKEWVFYNEWSIQGSCNGLVCLTSGVRPRMIETELYPPTEIQQPRMVVTNPITREFMEFTQHPIKIYEKQCLGFGYDSSSDDYKLVSAVWQEGKAIVRILSWRSDAWRLFGQINYRFDDSVLAVPGILFNGALHWFWLNPNDATRENILLVSFDLAKEEFREIPQPDDQRYVWNYGYKLGIIEGRLCIFPAYDEDFYPSCGIWVMKSNNSWELFPNVRQMNKDHAIYYMLKDTNDYRWEPPPTYFCDEDIELSRSKEHIASPMFVPSVMPPYFFY